MHLACRKCAARRRLNSLAFVAWVWNNGVSQIIISLGPWRAAINAKSCRRNHRVIASKAVVPTFKAKRWQFYRAIGLYIEILVASAQHHGPNIAFAALKAGTAVIARQSWNHKRRAHQSLLMLQHLGLEESAIRAEAMRKHHAARKVIASRRAIFMSYSIQAWQIAKRSVMRQAKPSRRGINSRIHNFWRRLSLIRPRRHIERANVNLPCHLIKPHTWRLAYKRAHHHARVWR